MPQKSKFSRLRRAEGCAYYFENLKIWISKGALINISKISRNAEERLLRGGRLLSIGWYPNFFRNSEKIYFFSRSKMFFEKKCRKKIREKISKNPRDFFKISNFKILKCEILKNLGFFVSDFSIFSRIFFSDVFFFWKIFRSRKKIFFSELRNFFWV